MQWPERPTCHGDNPMGFPTPTWRPPEPEFRRQCSCGYERVGPYGYPFRTCSYCGSMHPEDLARFLQAGDRKNVVCARCVADGIPEPTLPIEPTQEQVTAWRQWSSSRFFSHECRVTLGGSDWKRGYPHKFYVQGVPNPLAGRSVDSTSTSQSFDHEPSAEELTSAKASFVATYANATELVANLRPPGWCPGYPANSYWNLCMHVKTPAPTTTHAKFYTVHLEDIGYDVEAHDKTLELVSAASGIRFERSGDSPVDGRGFAVRYSAPYHGYQRA